MIRGSLNVFIVRVAQIAISTLTSVFLARVMGVGNYGAYTYIIILIATAVMPVQFGMYPLIIREAGINSHQSGFTNWAIKYVVYWAIFASLGLSLVISLDQDQNISGTFNLIIISCTITILTCAMFFLSGVAAATKNIEKEQFSNNIIRPVTFILTLFLFYILVDPKYISVFQALLFYSISIIIANFYMHRNALAVFERQRYEPTVQAQKAWRKSLVVFTAIGGIDVILQSFDMLMIGLMLNTNEVGIYRVGSVLGGIMALPLAAISTYLAPHLAEMDSSTSALKLHRWRSTLTRYSLAATIFILIIAFSSGEFIISLTFGDSYTQAYYVWMILGIASFFNALFGVNRLVLMLSNQEKRVFRLMIYAALLNIILNIALIGSFGALGAASATAISTIFLNILLHIECHRSLDYGVAAFSALPHKTPRKRVHI